MHLFDFGIDVLLQVLSYIDRPKDRYNTLQLCKHVYDIVMARNIWSSYMLLKPKRSGLDEVRHTMLSFIQSNHTELVIKASMYTIGHCHQIVINNAMQKRKDKLTSLELNGLWYQNHGQYKVNGIQTDVEEPIVLPILSKLSILSIIESKISTYMLKADLLPNLTTLIIEDRDCVLLDLTSLIKLATFKAKTKYSCNVSYPPSIQCIDVEANALYTQGFNGLFLDKLRLLYVYCIHMHTSCCFVGQLTLNERESIVNDVIRMDMLHFYLQKGSNTISTS
jgi:hypothetical protein